DATCVQRELLFLVFLSRRTLYSLRRGGITVQMSTTFAGPAMAESRGAAARRTMPILEPIRRYWGFEQLRPLQAEAIDAELAGRDSMVVLPTGGGKSLCYQVPPAVLGGTDVVISPLISLMKDQVDGLRECGYPAAAIYTGLDGNQRQDIQRQLA